jgi:hypothetical protein
MKTTEIKLPKKVQMEVERAIILRSKAKALEVEAKGMSDSAKEILLPILTAYSIAKYPLPGVGTVTLKTSKGSSIDATKLKENLLIAGVNIETIEEALSQSTRTWETEYVEFKGEKS